MKIISLTTTFAMVILLAFANLNVNAQAFELPFFEDWQSWHFETNQWQTDGDNWQMDTQNGNDAPSSKFHRTPILTDYSSALTSNTFDASLLSVGRIFLNFDLKLTDNNETGTEFIHFHVFDGTNWNKVDSVSNQGSFDWTAYSLEITNWAMGNNFQIRFLATGENSMDMLDWHIDNIEVYRECDRPEDLTGEVFWNNDDYIGAEIAWSAPESVLPRNLWKHWDSENNTGAISLTSTSNVSIATKWDAGMLSDFDQDTIESIRFYPNNDGFEYIVIKIWTDENADNLVYSDTAENVLIGEWNEHNLSETIIINSAEEIWIGYEIRTFEGSPTMGHDQGPAIAGYGDLINLDGDEWTNLSEYGHDFDVNWNIQMLVDAEPVINPEQLNGFNVFRKYIMDDNYTQINFVQFNEGQKDYNISDTCSSSPYDCSAYYKVNALWENNGDTCISAYARSFELPMNDFVCVFMHIGTEEILEKEKLSIFPNPTSTTLNIKTETQLQTVSIFNLFGQKVGEFDAAHKKELQIDVSKLKSGVYLLKAFDGETIISSKFIIQ